MFTIRKIEEKKCRKRLPWKSLALNALEFSRPVLHWYQDWKLRHTEEKRHKKRVRMLKHTLLILISAFAALLIVLGLAQAIFQVRILSFSHLASITGTALPTDEDGFTNLLLMGQGHDENTGKDLTDSIIVASLDPRRTQSVVLLSLPRDVYLLQTEKMGKGKLNTFYRDYKGYLRYVKGMDEEEATQEALREIGAEIGRTLELPIHGVVKVDFIAFKEAVDTLGGIDVDVPYDISDEEFPDNNYGFEPFHILRGPNHLDGETALKYARSRSTTSDFDRSARQQQVLKALAQKAKEQELYKDPGAILEFLRIFRENVETILSVGEMVSIASLAKSIDQNRIISMQLNDRNALYDPYIEPGGFLYTPPRDLFEGASVLLPISIPEFPVTWKQIQALKTLLFQTRSIYLEHPTIAVLNAGAKTGEARKLANELTRFGFKVEVVANASLDEQDKTFLATGEAPDTPPFTAETTEGAGSTSDVGIFFASLLGLETQELTPSLPSEEVRDVTIVLGKDHTFRPLQSLLSRE